MDTRQSAVEFPILLADQLRKLMKKSLVFVLAFFLFLGFVHQVYALSLTIVYADSKHVYWGVVF